MAAAGGWGGSAAAGGGGSSGSAWSGPVALGAEEAMDHEMQSNHKRSLLSSPHVGPVLCVRWSGTGEYALSGGQDRSVQLWAPAKEKHIKTYTGAHGREVKDVQISPSNDKFVSCGGDRTIFLWDVSTGECVRRLRGHDSAVNSLSYSADGGLLASGGYDQTARLWDLRAFSSGAVQSMSDARDSVTCVLLRGENLYAASMDGCVRRYDVRMGKKITDHIATPVSSLSLSHDSNCLLLSCLDSLYRLLDVSSGEVLNEYSGAVSLSYRMEGAFDNSDGFVCGGSEDGSVVVWDLVEARIAQRYLGHAGAVSSVAWHPSEKAFITAGVDGTIRYWK